MLKRTVGKVPGKFDCCIIGNPDLLKRFEKELTHPFKQPPDDCHWMVGLGLVRDKNTLTPFVITPRPVVGNNPFITVLIN